MSIENIVKKAMENDPMGLKEAFETEIELRIAKALEEKVASKKVTEEEKEECEHCSGAGYHQEGDEEGADKIECEHCEGSGVKESSCGSEEE
jgi:DnaJ-class molecular chaperone